MAFKLRSGNSPMFKSIGEEKETPEQYNARVRAEHEAKMQAYNDSTASYQNQVIIQNKLDEATGLETDNSGHVPETRYISGQDIIDAGGKVEGINWSKGKDADGNPVDPNTMYTIPIQGVTDEQKASNKVIADRTELQYQKGDRLIDEAYVLHEENKKRGIHSEDFSFNTNPDDLRPTKPREPMEMIDSIKIKNIDMGTTEMEAPKKLPPYELTKNKTEYFTTEMKGKRGGSYVKGDDGKSEMNLRDQAGRLVWSGTQAEYEEKYGEFLQRGETEYGDKRKSRLYLKD